MCANNKYKINQTALPLGHSMLLKNAQKAAYPPLTFQKVFLNWGHSTFW